MLTTFNKKKQNCNQNVYKKHNAKHTAKGTQLNISILADIEKQKPKNSLNQKL